MAVDGQTAANGTSRERRLKGHPSGVLDHARRLATVILVAALCHTHVGIRSAADGSSLLTGFSFICISIFDLAENHRFKFRDDISDRIAPSLSEQAEGLPHRMHIYSRPRCKKPGAFGYLNQISLELTIKRQKISLGDVPYNLVIIGGGSSNAHGALSDYEMMPIVLIQRELLSEQALQGALVQYVETRVLTLLKQ